ncbi:MAG: tetratricopeptide repeat protein [Cohaesibacteraceae bacterium]|nr:tetratricopeptide repeat protein [Cohaesibacteraceae bacterium]
MRSEKMVARIIGVVGILLAGVAVMPVQAAGPLQILEKSETVSKPVVESVRFEQIRKMFTAGKSAFENEKYEEARSLTQNALADAINLLGNESLAIAPIYSTLGKIVRAQKKASLAQVFFEKANSLTQKGFGEWHEKTAATHYDLALSLYDQRKYREAVELLDKTRAIQIRSVGKNNMPLADMLSYLARSLYKLKRYDEAHPHFKRSLSIHLDKLPAGNGPTGSSHTELAQNYEKLGLARSAALHYLKSLEIIKINGHQNHPGIAYIYNNLGLIRAQQGKSKQALTHLRKAFDIRRQSDTTDQAKIAESYHNLGIVLAGLGRLDEARPLLKRAMKISTTASGLEAAITVRYTRRYQELFDTDTGPGAETFVLPHPRNGPALISLNDKARLSVHPQGKSFEAVRAMMRVAAGLSDQGYYQKSSPNYDAIIEILRKEKGNNHQDVLHLTNPKAGNLEAQGQFVEAEEYRRNQLQSLQNNGDKAREETGFAHERLAYNLVMQGKFKQSLERLNAALDSHIEHTGRNYFEAARVQFLKAYVLAELGQMDKALPFFEEAAAFVQNTPGTMPLEYRQMLKALVVLIGYAPPWGPLERQKILEKMYGEKTTSEMDFGTIQPPLKARSRKQNLMYRAFRQLLSARALMAEGKTGVALVRMRQAMGHVNNVEYESGKAVISRRFKNTLQELLVLNGLHDEGQPHYQALAAREKSEYWKQAGYRTPHLTRMASHLKFAGKHKLATKIMNKANAITTHIKSGNPGPDHANLYLNRIDTLIAQQRFKEAEKSLRVYLHYGESRLSQPDSVPLFRASAYTKLAQVLLEQDHKAEARELLEKAIQFYRFGSIGSVYSRLFPEALTDHHFGEGASGRPSKEQNISRMELGKTWSERGLQVGAVWREGYHMRDVVKIQEQILAPNDVQLASAYRDIARSIGNAKYDKAKRFTNAKIYLDKAITALENNPAASPRDLIDAYRQMASHVGSTGDFEAMLPLFRKAVLIMLHAGNSELQNSGFEFANLASAHGAAGFSDVAYYLYQKAALQLKEAAGADDLFARKFASRAKEHINPKGVLGPERLLGILRDHAVDRMKNNDIAAAIGFYRDAMIIYLAEGGNFPGYNTFDLEFARALGAGMGDWTEATRVLAWSVDDHVTKNGKGHSNSIERSTLLAEALAQMGNIEAARQMFSDTLKLAKAKISPDREVIKGLGELIDKWSLNALKPDQLRQIAKWVEWNTPPDHIDRAKAWSELAEGIRTHGNYAEAVYYYLQALNNFEISGGSSSGLLAEIFTWQGLAIGHFNRGWHKEAEFMFRNAIARASDTSDGLIARVFATNKLIEVLTMTGELDEASRLLEQARADEKKITIPFPVLLKDMDKLEVVLAEKIRKNGGGITAGNLLIRKAKKLQDQFKFKEAERVYRKALKLLEPHIRGKLELAELHSGLASSLLQQHMYPETLELQRKAHALRVEIQGETHPETLSRRFDIGSTLATSGAFGPGLKIMWEVMETTLLIHGKDHINVQLFGLLIDTYEAEYRQLKAGKAN